jgi:lipopolysaccharide exporter
MNKVTAGALLLLLEKVAQRSLGLASTLILARMLTPEDFGIIALAMLTLWFVQTLTKAGSEAYIIQKDCVDDRVINSAWTLDLILKTLSFVVLLLSAPLISKYQESDSLLIVIITIGFILPITAFRNPGIWILQRNQDYSKIVKVSVFTKLIVLFITIPSAYYFKNYWAIVLGQVGSAALGTLLSYRISEYRPKLDLSNIALQWNFSKWIIPQELLSYFRSHIDTLIVSGKLANAELGAYNNMKYFASIPMLQFMTPLVAPLHAEMGKVQHDTSEMCFQSDITIKVMAFIAVPFASIGYVGSEEIIAIILGNQWIQYHKVFSYFSLMIVPFILLTQSIRLLVVKYHTKAIFVYEFIFTAVIAVFLIGAPLPSVEEFALFRVLSELIMSILFYCYASKVVFRLIRYKNIVIVIIPSFIVSVVLMIFRDYFLLDFSPFLALAILGFICALSTLMLFGGWYFFIASSRERSTIKKFSPVTIAKT